MGDNSSNNPVILEGSHGTIRSNVSLIERNGFTSFRSGRHGIGVYFWKKSPYWKELAIAWVKQKYNVYYERRIGGVVLYCKISTTEIKFFNIEQQEIMNKMLEMVKSRGLDHNDNKQISQLYDMIIKEMEEKRGTKMDVIEGTVMPPKKDFFPNGDGYPVQYAGLPVCLTVRNTACIKICNKIEFEI